MICKIYLTGINIIWKITTNDGINISFVHFIILLVLVLSFFSIMLLRDTQFHMKYEVIIGSVKLASRTFLTNFILDLSDFVDFER